MSQFERGNLAAAEVLKGEKKVGVAAKEFGVHRSTIYRHIQNSTKKYDQRKLLTPEDEKLLINWINEMAQCGFPVSKKQIIDKVKDISYVTSSKCRINSDFVPSQKWWQNFKKRNPQIVRRKADLMDSKRQQMSTEEVVNNFYDQLHEILNEHQLDPTCIWKFDETGQRSDV